MKYLTIVALFVLTVSACSTRETKRTEKMKDDKTKLEVEDDSKTMRIKVKIRNVANPVDYDKSFDVRTMTEEQKQTLKNKILDSLYSLNK